MKYFNKIQCITVALTLPEAWGDPTRIVNEFEAWSLTDAIWEEVSERIKLPNLTYYGCGYELATIQDIKCGFDVDCLAFQISDFETEKQFDITIEWLEKQMESAYLAIKEI